MTRDKRIKLARKTSTPPEVLVELSRDKDDYVRWYVARNTSTPSEILLILMCDDNKDVRESSEKNLSRRAMITERHAHYQE